MTWSTADIPDLSGRTVVVTGANGGLGLVCATELARRGAHVVMAARDPEKTDDATAAILAEVPRASLEVVPLDLASQRSAAEAASSILARHRLIDMLVLNAGIMAVPEGRTEDGFETQLAVNHLGHWTLTASLLPAVLAAPAARIVTTTSIARHGATPVDPRNPNLDGAYSDWRAYGQSKLANLHFALGLDRRLRSADRPARAIAADPGVTHSDLQKRAVRTGGGGRQAQFWQWYAQRHGMAVERGALIQLRAATDPRARGGALYGPRWLLHGSPVRLPQGSLLLRRTQLDHRIEDLWAASESLTGVPITIDKEAREL